MIDEEIARALNAERLDIRMVVDPANIEHTWLSVAQEQGQQLCRRSGLGLTFTLNCTLNIQAYALYRHNMVVVSVGCVDFLCRLADRIVTKGIFQDVGAPAVTNWIPTPEDSAQTIRALILQERFVYATAAWRGDPERESLFAYLMITLFRLVVLHEIGHFHHQHGERFTGQVQHLDADSAQPTLLPVALAVDSQARELVADKFACDLLSRILEDDITGLQRVRGMESFTRLYLDTAVKRTGFILQIAYLFFVTTDRLPDADPVTSVLMSHPPASFRLATIVATALTDVADQEKIRQINALAIGADAVVAVVLDRIPNVNWIAQLDQPAFKAHYESLYARVDAWAITPQQAPISATNPG